MFCHYVYTLGLRDLPVGHLALDPALLHLERQVLDNAIAALSEQAKRRSAMDLWCELVNTILSNDHEGRQLAISPDLSGP